jgi:hypothetical protein
MPVPKTINEFDSREFAAESHAFSSFAYLIGAFQAVSHALESISGDDASGSSIHPVESLAIATEGWLLLLPESKRSANLKNGERDELMFQAHMTMYA